jgi:AAA family ATP:ADP antiporter
MHWLTLTRRRGALIGLLRYGGIDGVLAAGQAYNQLFVSPAAADRILAAQVLEQVGVSQFYQPALTLLYDSDSLVQRAALRAAGRIKRPRLWPAVIAACNSPQTARVAVSALVAGGESALDAIAGALAQADTSRAVLMRLVQACRRIGGERTIRMLHSKLDWADGELRSQLLNALAACGYRANDPSYVHQQIQTEVAHAAWTAATLHELGDDQQMLLLTSALQSALQQTRVRVLCWLSFLYDAQALQRARDALAVGAYQAYALELIDTQLPANLKASVMPLMEELPPAVRLARWSGAFAQAPQTRAERLCSIISGAQAIRFSAWSRACALYVVGQLRVSGCAGAVASGLEDADARVREAARWARLRLDSSVSNGAQDMLSTIEKALILKTVSMFSQTPDDVLAAS